MYKIEIDNSDVVLLDFFISEKDWEDAEEAYGIAAFKGHSFQERMDLTAIFKVSHRLGEYHEYTSSLDSKGLEWSLYRNDEKII